MLRYQFFFFAICAARTSYGGLSDESTCNPLAPDSSTYNQFTLSPS